MSTRLMAAVFTLDIPASEKLVLLAFADHADDSGENCFPSISRIAQKCSMSRRGVQKILRRIESKGIIRSVGRRPNGTVKYRITVPATEGGEHGSPGERTTFAGEGRTLFTGAANLSARGAEHGSPESSLTTIEPPKRKNPAAKATPPADPRHQVVSRSCIEAYQTRYGDKPSWAGWEGKILQRFLAEHASIAAEEVVRRYRNLIDSTDRYHAQKHGSLCHLLGNFDVFADGPILAQKGRNNGKPDINEAVAITMQAAAANARRPN